jgi:hypothetical protein
VQPGSHVERVLNDAKLDAAMKSAGHVVPELPGYLLAIIYGREVLPAWALLTIAPNGPEKVGHLFISAFCRRRWRRVDQN